MTFSYGSFKIFPLFVLTFIFSFSNFYAQAAAEKRITALSFADLDHLNNPDKSSFLSKRLNSLQPASVVNSPVEIDQYSFENDPPHPNLDDGTIWRDQTNLNKTRFYGILGVVTVGDAVGVWKLMETLEKSPTSWMHSYSWSEDIPGWQQMDKFGHMTHANFATHFFSKSYRWAGFSSQESIWLGGLSGWLWMLQIELADSFFENWGFSWGDLIANSVGVALATVQQTWPNTFSGIQLKVSYVPSTSFHDKTYSEINRNVIDDYEGMTFWVAVNPYDYFPRSWQKGYPEWLAPLGIAFGHTAKGIASDSKGGHRELLVGLDIDLRKIPTGDNPILKFIKHNLNFIKLPLPAVKISPSTVWYGLYF